jgi:hypothetical protein
MDFLLLGLRRGALQESRNWLKDLDQARNQPVPDPPNLKTFKRSNKEIPELESYDGILGKEYWSNWTSYTFKDLGKDQSWVDGETLYKECERAGYRDLSKVRKVADYIKEGADIGCRGEGRLPTRTENDHSVATYGVRVADTIQQWIKDKICLGPFDEEDLPWDDYTVNPLKVRLKPNGSARLILDLSSPHQDDVELGQGIPMSVNSGIQKKDYITKMSSTRQWVKSLERAGVGARMSKADWQAAYKHLMVRPEDYRLQVFKFGEKFFIEIRLVFGAVSSPALFNDPARMAIIMAVMESGLDLKLVQQQLDDCCAAGRGEDGKLAAFTRIYRELCGRWGISLADVDVEKEKAFELETEGIVLGIGYDTISWSWWLPRDKLDWILIQLADLETAETITNGEMMRLNGKLAHYHVLVPGGKWWRTPLLDLSDSGGRKSKVYEVTEGAKECARWWFIRLMCMRQGPRRLADLRGGDPCLSC